MSKSTVEQLVGKLLIDAAFRTTVIADPASALAGYDLTDEERDAFTRIDTSSFDAAASHLDQRLSKEPTGRATGFFQPRIGVMGGNILPDCR